MGRAKNTVAVIKYRKNILILTGILLAVFGQNTADAAQPVLFKPALQQSMPLYLSEFIAEHQGFSHSDMMIARIDLNNDDIFEYIIKSADCTPAEGCAYLVIADSDEGYIIIAKFTGKNISISDKQTHGIRDILVYNQNLNDYAHTTLKWDMERMQYGFKQEQAG